MNTFWALRKIASLNSVGGSGGSGEGGGSGGGGEGVFTALKGLDGALRNYLERQVRTFNAQDLVMTLSTLAHSGGGTCVSTGFES